MKKKTIFALHAWLGLLLGLAYFLVSVSGATVVFVNELTELAYGRYMKYEPQPVRQKLSYDSLFAIAQREYPGSDNYVVGTDPIYPDNAPFVTGVQPHLYQLFRPNLRYGVSNVDPYSGKVLFRSKSTGEGDFFHWLVGFHDSFRLGAGGEFFVGILALLLLLSVISGFLLYRRSILRVLTFRERISFKNTRTTLLGLHRVIGTWALLVNILIFFSGFYLYKDYFTTRWWQPYSIRGLSHTQVYHPKKMLSLDTIMADAARQMPDVDLNCIDIELDKTPSIMAIGNPKDKSMIYYYGAALAMYDFDGKLKTINNKKWDEISTSEKFDNINFALLHTGWALGMPGKVIWTIVGFTPSILSLTGFILWWRRKKPRNLKKTNDTKNEGSTIFQ
jgi:uncharacterized iron-regulated membrane protein